MALRRPMYLEVTRGQPMVALAAPNSLAWWSAGLTQFKWKTVQYSHFMLTLVTEESNLSPDLDSTDTLGCFESYNHKNQAYNFINISCRLTEIISKCKTWRFTWLEMHSWNRCAHMSWPQLHIRTAYYEITMIKKTARFTQAVVGNNLQWKGAER